MTGARPRAAWRWAARSVPRPPRRAAWVASVALPTAAAVTVVATTAGLFSSASRAAPQQVATGTVTMSQGSSSSCAATAMFPGSSPPPCALTASYSGSAPAYLGLDILIVTQPGNGGTALYNPGDPAHDLQVSVTSTSPAVTYTVPTVATGCPATAPTGSSCYELDGELVSAAPFTSSSPPVTFTTSVSLPSATTTGYRGGLAQVVLTAHAAQSANNPATGCSVGAPCATVGWS